MFTRTGLVCLILAALTSFAFAVAAAPEKPNMKPEAMASISTDVVEGIVTAIYAKTELDKPWRYERYVAELKVTQVAKGSDLAVGDLVYARYWQRSYTGRVMPADTTGHSTLPKEGLTYRAYLSKNAYDGFHSAEDNDDGGFNVILPNGLELIERAPKKTR